jgi:hypothetical protein
MGRAMTARECQVARLIARTIGELIKQPIGRDKLMVEIDRRFPTASYKSFLAGLFLFQRERQGGTLQ